MGSWMDEMLMDGWDEGREGWWGGFSRKDTRKCQRLNNAKAKRGVVLVWSWCGLGAGQNTRSSAVAGKVGTLPRTMCGSPTVQKTLCRGSTLLRVFASRKPPWTAGQHTNRARIPSPCALLPCCPVALPRRGPGNCSQPDTLAHGDVLRTPGCLLSAVTGEQACGAPHWTAPNASPDRSCAIRGRCGRWLSGGATGWTQTALGLRDVSDFHSRLAALRSSSSGGGGSSGGAQLKGDPAIWPAITITAVVDTPVRWHPPCPSATSSCLVASRESGERRTLARPGLVAHSGDARLNGAVPGFQQPTSRGHRERWSGSPWVAKPVGIWRLEPWAFLGRTHTITRAPSLVGSCKPRTVYFGTQSVPCTV